MGTKTGLSATRAMSMFLVSGWLTANTPLAALNEPGPADVFVGTWVLDVLLSDHPEQVATALRFDTGQFTPEEFSEPVPDQSRLEGAGGAPSGRPAARRGQAPPRQSGLSRTDARRLADLVEAVRFASPTIAFARANSGLTMNTVRGGTETLHADGSAERVTLPSGAVDRSVRWEGPVLVVAYSVGQAGVLTWRYRVVPTGQLLVRVNFERPGRGEGPFDVKLVYNRGPRP